MSAEHDGFLDAVITNPLTMESAKRICREIKDRIATLEAERDAARADANFRTGQLTASRRHCEEATIERDRAVRALTRSGWTLTEGASEWKPPIGLRPDFEEIDRLRDALAKKQRAIDEAYAMGLERKAKAFDAVARGDVGIGCRPNSNDTMKRDWVAYQLTPPRRCSNDLLTAIERATREAQP